MKLTAREWLKILPLEIRKKIILNDYNIIKYSLNNNYISVSDMLIDFCSWSESHDYQFYNNLNDQYSKKEKNIKKYLPHFNKKEIALFYKLSDDKT